MLFWIILAIAVIGLFVASKTILSNDIVYYVSAFIGAFAGIAAIVMFIVIIIANVGNDGYIAKMNTRYDHLVYQYENELYENDNDVGKRELMADIQSWNEDLANHQVAQDDFWIGIFNPDIYDQFEFIELK